MKRLTLSNSRLSLYTECPRCFWLDLNAGISTTRDWRTLVFGTLTDLLAVGGCLILPVGAGQQQSLVRVRRTSEGLQQDVIEPAHFVPMLGGVIH